MERPIFKPIGSSIYKIDTPALVINLNLLNHNIKTLHSFFKNQKCKVRPFVSTHMCPSIAHKQIAAGNTSGISVSSLSQANLFAEYGFGDIFITNKIVSSEKIKKSLSFLKNKAKTLEDIFNNSQYLINDKIKISPEDQKLLDNLSKAILKDFLKEFENLSNINKENLEKIINNLIKNNKTNFKGVGQPLRVALVGSKFGPGIYDIIMSLDKSEVIERLKAAS